MRVHLLWGRCCRRGTTAACVLNCAAPDASRRARLDARLREFETPRNQSAKAISPERVRVAPIEVQGGFCDGRMLTEPAQITPALSAHPAGRACRGRAATGREAGAIDPIGASLRCLETSGALEPAAGLPERPLWAGPGSTRREADRSRRIYMMLYIDEKRGDARPRTSRNVG